MNKLIVFGLVILPFLKSFSQSEELNAVFSDLIYDPSKSYSQGSAVLVSLEDGEIYTASQDIPSAVDGSNGPNGANGSTYWGDSTTTTNQFKADNPTFLNDLPSDIDIETLSTQVAELVGHLVDPSEPLTTKLDWFGLRFEKGKWGFHTIYGWIYFKDADNEHDIWFFIPSGSGDLPASWNWTSRDAFPFVYNSELEWLEFSGPAFFTLMSEPLEDYWDEEWDEEYPEEEYLVDEAYDIDEEYDEDWFEYWEDEGWIEDPWEDEYWDENFGGMINYHSMETNDLVYHPHNFYEPGQPVITSLQDGQIYTAIKEVPWGKNYDSYSPTGPNGANYWQTFEQIIATIEEKNPDLHDFPDDLNMEILYSELVEFWGWDDDENWEEDELENFPGFFLDLIYNPLKSYPSGSAVLLDIEYGEIYTSKTEVPAGKSEDDDTFSPEGPNSRTYWSSSFETALTFEINNPNFSRAMPRHFEISALSMEIAELIKLDKEDISTMHDLFGGLLYDPTRTYYTGEAVVLSVDEGEIFTAKKKVPAAPDGTNAPDGENGERFWLSSFETIEDFGIKHANFWEALPDDIDWEDLHTEVSKLSVPDDWDSDNDGLSDYSELFEYKTDPETDDSDEDGLPDHMEIQLGSNPAESDEELVDYLKGLGEEEARNSILNNLSSHGLVKLEEYEKILEQIELSTDTNATPYTPDWFYLPERGWMWTDKSVYPYFFDSKSNGFLYFQAGFDKPRYYNFKKEEWFTLE